MFLTLSIPIILIISSICSIIYKLFYVNCSWEDTVVIALFTTVVVYIINYIILRILKP